MGLTRIVEIDTTGGPGFGFEHFKQYDFLRDKEVVLTFDDGPLPPYTDRILQTLAAECVKATFFMVGRQANAYPSTVRRVYNEGHTIASHSQNHPLIFTKLTLLRAQQESVTLPRSSSPLRTGKGSTETAGGAFSGSGAERK